MVLYLVSTPIGHLKDITLHAIEVLKEASYILCEDTRHTSQLLLHYKIKSTLKSYHKFNEARVIPSILEDLKQGKHIALVSDAGTPLISDPGLLLVQACYKEGLRVTSIPGPSSPITALILSGFETLPFQFLGFLPRTKGELERVLSVILAYSGTSIAFESKERLIKTLEFFNNRKPAISIVVLRELTKTFEQRIQGTPQELIQYFSQNPLKGEVILVIERSHEPLAQEKDLLQEVKLLVSQGIRLKDAVVSVADQSGTSKRNLYQAWLHNYSQ